MKRACAILLLLVLVVVASSCNKTPEPNPNPNQPTPVVPTKEITIVWNWDAGIGWAPKKDSIKYYTNQDSVKSVFIHLIGRDGIDYPVNCSGYYASSLHIARDTLQTRIDIDSCKVALGGTICVSNTSLPNHATGQKPGIAWYDKEWFERHGCDVIPAHSK